MSSSSTVGCPLCGLTWETLGLGGSPGEREEHAAACLENEGAVGEYWEDLSEEATLSQGSLVKKKPTRPKPKFDWADAGKGQEKVKGTAGEWDLISSLCAIELIARLCFLRPRPGSSIPPFALAR